MTNGTVNPEWIIAVGGLYLLAPICVQVILLLRLVVVYPPRLLSLPVSLGIYGTAVAIKVAQVINASYLLHTVQNGAKGVPKSIASESADMWFSPYAKVNYFLQLSDDTYVQR